MDHALSVEWDALPGSVRADALDRLGRDYRISEVCVKPYPSGRATHGGVVAALNLKQAHGLSPDQVASGTYRAPALIRHLVGRASQPGMAVSHARLCLPYLIAVALTRGEVGLSDFTLEALSEAASRSSSAWRKASVRWRRWSARAPPARPWRSWRSSGTL